MDAALEARGRRRGAAAFPSRGRRVHRPVGRGADASGAARPGDYGYEAIGAHHEKTHAAEEMVIVYVGHGPLAVLDGEGKICGATGSDGVNAFAMAHG